MMQEKRKELRRQMREQRDRLDPDAVKKYSRRISAHLWELDPIRKASNIMIFASMGNEVDLSVFQEEALAEGKKIFMPRVEGKEIVVVPFEGWDKMKLSSFGVREPVGETVDPADLDVVIVPGLVFDGRGFRLGYGKGYYDRFLPRLKEDAFACGVCYEFQVVETIYPHEEDVPVHWIVTDRSELAIDFKYF